jgi:hypothetical protein
MIAESAEYQGDGEVNVVKASMTGVTVDRRRPARSLFNRSF